MLTKKKSLIFINILLILISLSYQWNQNTCAWGAMGKNQPEKATDCLGDQTNPTAHCCYLKLQIMGQTIFKLCYSLPKYIVNSGTDEELTKGLQNDIGNLFKIMELNCRSDNPVEKDTRNERSLNTCAYDNLKYEKPKEIEDCVKDKDPSNSSKCCYIETTWDGVKSKSCNTFSKIRDLDFPTWQTVYKSMGGELNKMECKVPDKTPEPQFTLKKSGGYLIFNFRNFYNLIGFVLMWIFAFIF